MNPIKDKKVLEHFKKTLLHQSYRNYMLFVMAINTGFPIDFILNLKVKDVMNTTKFILPNNKNTLFHLPVTLQDEIKKYIKNLAPEEYLFKSRQGKNEPIKREMVYHILNNAAKEIGFNDRIGVNTLRKTFGYHFFKQTGDYKYLQNLFNQSAPSVTLKYIGFSNEEAKKIITDGFSL